MPQKDVIRRTTANNRRKNNDGDRTDSGCFEDVDVLQMANRHCQTSGSELTPNTASSDGPTDRNPPEIACASRSPNAAEVPVEAPFNSDEHVDDAEFRAILERLAEVTKNPGDLYRLCFSSRLSFCGLSFGGFEEEGVSGQNTELLGAGAGSGSGEILTATRSMGTIEVKGAGEGGSGESQHKNCGNRQQCVELLSLLSSFVEKARENPAVFSQSSLGKSLLGQLSSLLCTLEEARKSPNTRSHVAKTEPPIQTPLNAKEPSAVSGHRHQTSSINPQPPPICENGELTSQSPMPEQLPHGESDEGRADLLSHESEESTADSAVFEDATESMSLTNHANEESSQSINGPNSDHVFSQGLDIPREECGDVVSNGRRAVKPYSWDYGDIWEKELQRTQSTDSFNHEDSVSEGSIPGGQLVPSFEEIRDDLFHQAGFIRGDRPEVSKRRSRSADARSSLQDDPEWFVSFPNEQTVVNSPFVRTIYQHQGYSSSGLTRSRSSHLLGGNSLTINIDRSQGRRVHVYSEHPQLDHSRALFVREAVVETSTFRGPKPWAALKRRPSGLRRRSNSAARPESFSSDRTDGSTEFPRIRLDSHGESESSDSPYYVSAASSDCLTTDDSSSVTSSHYAAASSVQSSPTVSNRSSACFSDGGSSDLSDLRRVIFRDSSSSESYPGEKYTRNTTSNATQLSVNECRVPTMNNWGMTLDQRFSSGSNNNQMFQEPGDQRLKITANNARKAYQRNGSLRGSDPSRLRGIQTNISGNWSKDHSRTPVLVRSDSDLSHLTKVQFIGDSYSRSHISKNVRHVRRQSRSPSPVPRANHTRVVSCEIVQSNKDKRDVYTKVNLSRYEHDGDTTSDDVPNPTLGPANTRRSWHGHSPPRGFTRSMRTNTNPPPRRVNSERYTSPTGLVDRRRQAFHPKKSDHLEEKPLHAKLVEVKNIRECHMRPHNSTGSLRSSFDSDGSRHWSDARFPANNQRYHRSRYDRSRQFTKDFATNRNNSFSRAQAFFERQQNPGVTLGCRRPTEDQTLTTYARRNNYGNKERDLTFGCNRQECFQNTKPTGNTADKIRVTDGNPKMRTNGRSEVTKEPVIVKETSFVGPSTFTKYQSPSNPSVNRSQRSRSFNEKDSFSRRKLQENDFYRRRALEIAHGDKSCSASSGYPLSSDSDSGVVRRPDRRRRYSEGAPPRPSRTEGDPHVHLVDESYCDPRRESIREGTYCIASAESARHSLRSGKDRPDVQRSNPAETKNVPVPVMIAKETIENNVYSKRECEDGQRNQNKEKRLSGNNVELTRNSSGSNDVVQDVVGFKGVETTQSNSVRDSGNRGKGSGTEPAVLCAEETPQTSGGVSVCIDYRNKRPVSVEYCTDDGGNTRSEDFNGISKMPLLKKGQGRTKQVVQTNENKTNAVNNLAKGELAAEAHRISKDTREEEFPRKRLSRRDRHEQELFSNTIKGNQREEVKCTKPVEEFPDSSSPVPYRRDNSIIYIDARSCIDSDTDSTSHDSSISSSGSDMTVILNDDKDISAGDLRQLTQNSSEIGIEISPLELDSSDDLPDSSDSTPEKNNVDPAQWSMAVSDATRSSYGRYCANSDGVKGSRVIAVSQEPGCVRDTSFTLNDNRNDRDTLERLKQNKSKNVSSKYEQNIKTVITNTAEHENAESPLSSNASSLESSKGIGASSSDGSKGKFSTKNEGGKGLFSRLKSFRNSFRGKKTEQKSPEKGDKSYRKAMKNAEKEGKMTSKDIKTVLGSRSLPIIDDNSNEMAERTSEVAPFSNTTTSSDYCTKSVRKESSLLKDDKSRRSYDALKQPSVNLRSSVGLKSVSSDHLHSLRVERTSFKMSAKSLEVLLETCI